MQLGVKQANSFGNSLGPMADSLTEDRAMSRRGKVPLKLLYWNLL